MAFPLLAAGASAAQPIATAPADARVTPGEFVIEHPTLINLGFEWHVDGDANRNASVDVSFRKQGETAWRKALPLARLHGEQVFQRNVFNLVTPNMFAGSILDLEPGATYEARFVMTDPDGVNGAETNATRIVTVRTRPEPVAATGGKTYHVYPTKWAGPKSEPAFEGIMCAYNYYCGAGDTAPGGRPRVKPGDTILVHAGTYAYHYEFYANNTQINATTTFEGTYYLTADGTPDKPIVIKAAGDGQVIIDGRGNFNLFNVKAADYNYFEGITFRNTQIAIWAGTQFIAGSKGLTVKRCRFEDVGMGVFSNYSGSSDFYIADSVFLGRNDPKHLTGWNGSFWQQFENMISVPSRSAGPYRSTGRDLDRLERLPHLRSFVVSSLSRTARGPPEGGHYMEPLVGGLRAQTLEVCVRLGDGRVGLREYLRAVGIQFLRFRLQRRCRCWSQIAAKVRDLVGQFFAEWLQRVARLSQRLEDARKFLLAARQPLLRLALKSRILDLFDRPRASGKVRVPRRLHGRHRLAGFRCLGVHVVHRAHQLLVIAFHVFRRLRDERVVRVERF